MSSCQSQTTTNFYTCKVHTYNVVKKITCEFSGPCVCKTCLKCEHKDTSYSVNMLMKVPFQHINGGPLQEVEGRIISRGIFTSHGLKFQDMVGYVVLCDVGLEREKHTVIVIKNRNHGSPY